MNHRHRVRRIAAVTAGLAAAGAAAGALVGVGIGLLGVLIAGSSAADAEFFTFAALFSAAVGAVLGPATAWLLMRHVPFGRAIGATALGTVAGALVGMMVPGPFFLYGGLIGFALGAVSVRLLTPRRAARAAIPPAAGGAR
jgi:hypothetical protein